MSKTNSIIIIMMAVITAVAVGVSVCALFFRSTSQAKAPDYAPRQIESNAEADTDNDDSKLTQPSGGGAVSIEYSKEVTLSLGSKTAALYFKNPSKSTQDMVLQLSIDGKTIAESGKLPAGYKLEKLSVDTDKLSEGEYNGKLTVLYYDAESGEKAMVNTEIIVTITVTQ